MHSCGHGSCEHSYTVGGSVHLFIVKKLGEILSITQCPPVLLEPTEWGRGSELEGSIIQPSSQPSEGLALSGKRMVNSVLDLQGKQALSSTVDSMVRDLPANETLTHTLT